MLGTSRAVATLLATVLLTSPAVAQPAPSAGDKQLAQDLVKQAITKSQAKEHDEAIELYIKAYTLVPLPTLLSNIGTEYKAAEKPVEALKYFCMYLEKDPTGTLATYAGAQAVELQEALGHEGLAACAPLPDPTTGPGSAGLSGSEAGAGGVTGTGDLGTKKPSDPWDPGSGMKATGMITGGVGLVALGAGFYFGNKARKISDDISSQPMDEPWRTNIQAYEAEGQRAENFQIACLIGGGALVVGGTVLYILGRSKASSAGERMAVTPTATGDGAGVTLHGRF